ncbi:MAG: hypothetical protein KDJ47_11255 [Hyphomicrobiaceae bacterium]|nr:hypothetical protein [Hyphomicrobiaceae bacterium]
MRNHIETSPHSDRDFGPSQPEDEALAASTCETAPAGPAASRWSTRSVALIGLLGFTAGALTWHLVGFWTFVSVIVFNPQDDTAGQSHTSTVIKTSAVTTAPTAQPAATPATSQPQPSAPTAVTAESLTDLLQCSEARKATNETIVQACPPLRQRIPAVAANTRANRQLDAREAANRLANGWSTGVSSIETGALPTRD